MRRYKILHRTYYNFPEVVQLQPHTLLLRPREGHELRIESSNLDISPKATLRWRRDVEDNSVAVASFSEPTNQLKIESEVIIQHYNEAPLDFLVADYARDYPFAYQAEDRFVLAPYLAIATQPAVDTLKPWLAGVWQAGEKIETYSLLQRLNKTINQSLTYQLREEPGVQAPEETLALGSGSCRDSAYLFMEAARRLGLAARFVSGYLHTPPSATDFGSTHAWAEVLLPGAGWKGFDPTIGEMVGADHIPIAVARSPQSVPPVAGAYVGAPGASLDVGVWVTELK
ncbi:MAG: transglutaminase family protein [Gammaproteobacteria bacterium]|uniref:transglutaminase family protein n=1 Tax=Pseudomaricurvus alcaniphilus TaxID=1166482 RepID=UPI0014075F89|nr:transglutaminase family protein [Pseudomaricurvus alcaniphilus]MBR9912458.1 transglutaminase family protein [Gammaproteobacteria bacterium]NHN37400.1 transglutaminase family protein [Pseudomaricurvus alcaniphilus]